MKTDTQLKCIERCCPHIDITFYLDIKENDHDRSYYFNRSANDILINYFDDGNKVRMFR